MTTALAKRERAVFSGLESAANLPAGSISLVGLNLPASVDYDAWQTIMRGLGHVNRWTVWALGDALNFGIDTFGEEAVAAAVEGPADRYNMLSRLTGLHPDTLRNYASLAARIARSRRRVELPPLTHEPVAKLEPAEQESWLERAVEEGWTREELRAAINGPRNGGSGGGLGRRDAVMVFAEQVEYTARRVLSQARKVEDGYLVPAHIWEPFAAALEGGEA